MQRNPTYTQNVHVPNRPAMCLESATQQEDQGVIKCLMALNYTKLGEIWFRRDHIDVFEEQPVSKKLPTPASPPKPLQLGNEVLDVDFKELGK